ncbi:putative reverse transcriptase domain-containing protein, partial [Tanacetum coccineum]
MDLETAQTTTTAKLPILKQGEYDMWRLKIKQYFQVQDYVIWDVIENRNSFKPVPQIITNVDGSSTSLIPGPVTTEEKVQKKNDVNARNRTMKYPKGIVENVLVGIGKFVFPIDFIILDMTEDIKVPLILRRPFLSTTRAKIDVYKRKITLRVREERIVFTSIKPASNLIKRVYMLSFRERMDLDLEAMIIGETLVLNRSLDPFFKDYIELIDINEPIELRRNQGIELIPTIEEEEVIEEFRTRDDKLILEDMDAYRDEGMGNVIFSEPFLREVRFEMRRWKNGSHTGTLAYMRWNSEGEAEKK